MPNIPCKRCGGDYMKCPCFPPKPPEIPYSTRYKHAVNDIKLLRHACTAPLINPEDISIDTDWEELSKLRWTMINAALAATNRLEYET